MANSIISIRGYNLFRSDSPTGRAKHGVCTYIKDTIKAIPSTYQFPNSLAIHLPTYNLHILTVYKPPSYTPQENTALCSYIQEFSVGKELLIMGDFNLPSIAWNLPVIDLSISQSDSLFLNLFSTLGLYQHVRDQTFLTSGNILDLVLTSDPDRLFGIKTFPPFPHCGHCLVSFNYLFQNTYANPNKNPFKQLNWPRGDYHHLNIALNTYDWDFEFHLLNTDETAQRLTTILTDLAPSYVPEKPPSSNVPPWFKRVPKHLIRQKSTAWKDYTNTRKTHGRNSYLTQQKLHLFHTANAALSRGVVAEQSSYEHHLIAQRNTKPKLFHSYIRNKKVSRPTVGPLKINNSLSDDPLQMSNQFVDAFVTVFTTGNPVNPYPHQCSNYNISTVKLTVAEIELLLKNLNTDSAMGPDNLHPILLQRCASSLAYPLYILFNKSLSSGIVPEIWKQSHVTPIYKKGPRTNPLNYRPISLTPIPCKTLERIITKNLYSFLDEHLLFDDRQFGFRSRRSVTDQLLLAYNNITQWYDQGYTVDLLLFDFIKAFDKVHHQTLLNKLSLIGIRGNLYRWIESFLSNRTMKVSINGTQSKTHIITSGVPQGSVLGPLLFLLMVNHLGSNLTCHYMLFADDLKLYLHHPDKTSQQTSVSLQNNINILTNTASSWGLKFAPDKCVHLQFQRGHGLLNRNNYHIDGHYLETVQQHKDLGVTIDTKLRFHSHIRKTVNKAGGVATNFLKSTVCRSPTFMTTLFISDIRPIIDFASPVWNTGFSGDRDLLESVQRRWTKQVQNLSTLSYYDRLSNLNMFSIKGRLLRTDLILCYKIFNNLSSIKPTDLFELSPYSGNRGHKHKIFVPYTNTEARKRFYSIRVIKFWNSLPSDVVNSTSVNQFKHKLAQHLNTALLDY